ncbi:hypothetical protein BU17DRAFT_83056 [Hysterangium stoloniferum]|nr:hypothetical protein BU17DRAFT_83056 [Hysterangium stoloniferum]
MPMLPPSKHARYSSKASNMQIPHPHSPMNMNTLISPLFPNFSSMVTSVTSSPQAFEGESDAGIFTDSKKDASSPTKKRT